jgi:hypothetical protein
MNRTALLFPVLPGKTEEDIKSISEKFRADPKGYFESRQRAGVTLERAYWQHTPMGDFVVAYSESEGTFADVTEKFAEQATEIDRFFIEAIKKVHGIDITEPLPGPPPETVGEWVDPAVTERRRGMAFLAPLLPGQEEHGRTWARETFSQEEMTESRRALHQNVEVVTLVQTPQGPAVGVYLEGEDPFQGNRTFAASTKPFDVRFKDELRTLTPPSIDFSQPVPGVTEIFDSTTLPKPA